MSMRAITSIAVHCAYTSPAMDIGVAEIRRWHLARGFSDIGYHFVIRRDGSIETGRTLERSGAHVAGHNARSIGVCLAGGKAQHANKPEANFNEAQLASLRALLTELSARFPNAEIMGHCDYPGVAKPCPCFDVRTWWNRGGAALPPLSQDKAEQGFWPGIEYFSPSEFDRDMHPEFVKLLDRARKAAGKPFVVERTVSGREAVVRVKL